MAGENKKANLGALMKTPKTRNMVLVTGGVLGIAIIYALMTLNGSKQGAPSQAQVGAPPTDMRSVPGAPVSQAYLEMQKIDNARKAEAAIQSGGSAMPVLLEGGQTLAPTESAPAPKPVAGAPLQPVVAATYSPPPPPRFNPAATDAMRANMTEQVRLLFDRWTLKPSQPQYDLTQKNPAAGGVYPVASQVTGISPATQAPSGGTTPAPLVTAGTLWYGVLRTAVNSDEPGPVLARVVQGPLSGAVLVGTVKRFQAEGNSGPAERVALHFTRMTLPGPSAPSLTVDAYAVDPDSARTALATGVDHHYLGRMASLLSGSFLTVLGKSWSAANQTYTATATGVVATPNNTSMQALGKQKAGDTLGEIGGKIAKGFDRVPTVHVEGNTGLGLLFVSDVADKS